MFVEVNFSTPQSEGEYDSRIIECDSWRWSDGMLELVRERTAVAAFVRGCVLGVVDLSAMAEVEDDDEGDYLDIDEELDELIDDETVAEQQVSAADTP
jgi:hypothetical protein